MMENKLKANGESKSIRQVLDTQKYYIDYYQREYKWTSDNVIELLNDLENKFLSNVKLDDERKDVQNYNHYFLGSIIVNIKDNKKYIIDGQQRLTTITLLLIYLNKLQKESNFGDSTITNLIYSTKFGEKSFNMDIEERNEVMNAIFNEKTFNTTNENESIKNIKERYETITDNFPESLKQTNGKNILPFFIDWFIESVDIVEITTYSDDDAYTIFETMNDRGLSLSQADMLKGYVLTQIKDETKRNKANTIWKKQINSLMEYNKKEESDFFKAWFRAKYAETMRERKRGASNKDFEIIGVQFHRWIRENKSNINLNNSDDFFEFVKEFEFFSAKYLKLKEFSDNLEEDYKEVFYNNYNNFTLQYPLILAPLKSSDTPEIIKEKIQLVSKFIDTFIVLRSINRRTLGYSSVSYTIFKLIKKIRDKEPHELSQIFKKEIEEMDEKLDGSLDLILHSQNKRFVHFLLARITDYIEQKSSRVSNFESYVSKKIKDRFEVEHIIPNKYIEYMDEFRDPEEFEYYRNKLGNLLLLPSSFNKSYNDSSYEIKVEHYFGQNLLARSLNSKCYNRDPSFKKFVEESGINFRAYEKFLKDQIKERTIVYNEIINQIWNLTEFS